MGNISDRMGTVATGSSNDEVSETLIKGNSPLGIRSLEEQTITEDFPCSSPGSKNNDVETTKILIIRVFSPGLHPRRKQLLCRYIKRFERPEGASAL